MTRPNGALAPAHLMVRQTLAIARRILTEYVRQRRSLIFWAVFPALMLLLFGLMYRNNASLQASFDATAAGILIGAALFFSCLGGTVSLIVAERERRTLRRLLVSPLHPAAYFLGLVLALSVIAFCQAVIVYALAHAMGARYHGSVWLGVLIVALSVFAYVGLGFFFGARFAKRAEDVNGPVAALLAAVPAKAIALVETAKKEAVLRRAGELGWGIRNYAGQIGCLLPQQVSLREVVEALQDIEVSAVSVQRVSLDHAYLEVVQSET